MHCRVNYQCNLSPSRALDHIEAISFLNAWHGKIPDLSHLKIVDRYAFVHIARTFKLQASSWRVRFIGYSSNMRGCRIYNKRNGVVYESRQVTFMSQSRLSTKGSYEHQVQES